MYGLVVLLIDAFAILPAHPVDWWIRILARWLLPFVVVFDGVAEWAWREYHRTDYFLTALCFGLILQSSLLAFYLSRAKRGAHTESR
jgi:hypothetical protein